MRLDKYLKISRIIKRRTLAKELIDASLVYINHKVAKPSSEVKVNDELVIYLKNRILTIQVLSVDEKIKAEDATNLYSLIKEEERKIEL